MSEELFIDPASFHVTLGVMKLFTKDDISRAVDVLEGVKQEAPELFAGSDQRLTVRGLDIMQPRPDKV